MGCELVPNSVTLNQSTHPTGLTTPGAILRFSGKWDGRPRRQCRRQGLQGGFFFFFCGGGVVHVCVVGESGDTLLTFRIPQNLGS